MFDSWFNDRPAAPAPVTRSAEQQAAVDAATAGMALYHYDSCMFCARVRRAIATLGLTIELRDVLGPGHHRDDLLAGGGKGTVPCLRIDDAQDGSTRWMYESADIIRYLTQRFGEPPTAN